MKRFSIAILLCIAMPAFAESAPVYDADSMPQQQFEAAPADQSAQDNLPPAPDQEAFVPASQPQMTQPTAVMSTDQRLKRIEQQVNNMQTSDASARMDSLQNQVQLLREQVEQLNHQLQLMQSQQKNMFADMDKRISQPNAPQKKTELSQASPTDVAPVAKANVKAKKPTETVAQAAETTSSDQPNVAEEQQIYQTAYNQIKAKNYQDAVNTLQGMLKKYPSGQFASNAHYWLGELYGLMGKNDQALVEFSTVLKTYPDSPRVSDAQLKVGLIFASQSKWADAKGAFKRVINHYPGTASARLAAEHLKQIKQAGN